MKGLSLSILFVIGICLYAKPQNAEITSYIKAWKMEGIIQTSEAEKTYDVLKSYRNINKYFQVLKELYAYLEEHPNDRLRARILMFDVLGRVEYKHEDDKSGMAKCMKEAIVIASKLKDEQLLAEIYALAGQIDLEGGFLLYNFKAVELQKKIGFQHFSFVQNRFFNISFSLYNSADYAQSISYGLIGLKFKNIAPEDWDKRTYIFQLDMIGASYKHLKKYDSAHYYYQKIIDALQREPDIPPVQNLWIGIAKGNLGQILAMQGKEKEAIPLVNLHLTNSIKARQWNNVAMAQNTLSTLDLKNKRYAEALKGFKSAYVWAKQSSRIDEVVTATNGLAEAYRFTHVPDSAYKYYSLKHEYQDTLAARINRHKLSATRSRIAFDNAQSSLERANDTISAQRLTRNFILIGIVLLAIIALLFFNRRMLQQEHLAEEIKGKQYLAEQETHRVKEQISSFTANIIEKENLIQDLQKQIAEGNGQINQSLLQYTLITDKEWEKFRIEFHKAYPGVLNALKTKLPSINPGEERLATLLFLNLSSNQIANTLGIGKDSVGRSKRRLKQRLNLPSDKLLEEYLSELA
ncbi:MAG: hypothetical protein V4663_17865 [Bacteroidota bacterium]